MRRIAGETLRSMSSPTELWNIAKPPPHRPLVDLGPVAEAALGTCKADTIARSGKLSCLRTSVPANSRWSRALVAHHALLSVRLEASGGVSQSMAGRR